ncbi:hypothetical protein DPMN_176437 [Dreissena polymorpha]|uniref:Uncharacterized protein n=1 Tax=Dreissena polymorpha TaxID=45954 RepID=A0A9D4IGX1_DREPO|nr:hypothetical protein DPMN_176437 [Dreissena polymorpha]
MGRGVACKSEVLYYTPVTLGHVPTTSSKICQDAMRTGTTWRRHSRHGLVRGMVFMDVKDVGEL